MRQAKNVYIMGAGAFGKYVYDQLLEYSGDWHVLGYIDSDINKKDIEKDGLKIYHLFESPIDTIDGSAIVFIAVRDKKAPVKLAYQLNTIGFLNIYEVKNSVFSDRHSFVSASGLDLKHIRKYKIGNDGRILPIFTYLETHVMDGCNLKCKGCSHFSNLFCTDSIVEYEQYKNDIMRLSEICNITLLRLLGGEPLLNERLIEYLSVARESFPYADLRIVTNGVLVTICPETVLQYISANNIVMNITMYKPSFAMKERIVERLDNYHVSYRLAKENCDKFNKILTLNGNNAPESSIRSCARKKCIILKQGSLYRCPISAYVFKYNERYGTEIESEELFNIYTDPIDRLREIALENPAKPVSTCKYCVETPVYFTWEQSLDPKKEEWLV